MSQAIEVLHDSSRRLRLRLPEGADPLEVRVRLQSLPGVANVRVAEPIRSVAVAHDGLELTRAAIIEAVAYAAGAGTEASVAAAGADTAAAVAAAGEGAGEGAAVHAPAAARGRRARLVQAAFGPAASVGVPAVGLAAIPWLPARAQQGVALSLVGLRTLQGLREGRSLAALAVEGTSLAATALTGHPATSATSVLLGSVARVWRDRMVRDNERLLQHLTPAEAASYRVRRGRANLVLAPTGILPGDVVTVPEGAVVPVDGYVHGGQARLAPRVHHDASEPRALQSGAWVSASERVISGAIRVSALRAADRSRAERLRGHVRHALASADPPGGMTPDLNRLLALPVTTAGIVLALTRDAGRSAAMLQADPQEALALAHPLARESAIYLLAREGLLMAGMDPIERLAACRAMAFQDIGIVTSVRWKVVDVEPIAGGIAAGDVRRLLARLARRPAAALPAGLHDEHVRAWHEHGGLTLWRGRPVHVGGAAVLKQAWGLELPVRAPRPGVCRTLGLASERGLLATVVLETEVRPNAAATIAALREAGVRRIAVLAEDVGTTASPALEALGADAVVCADRRAQSEWLAAAARAGLHPALLHRGLRELLPPGGLSLCPADAEAGAHGVTLGDPLTSLVAGLGAARSVRRRLRADFGAAVAVNGALIFASATRLISPLASAALHHAFAFAVLRRNRSF